MTGKNILVIDKTATLAGNRLRWHTLAKQSGMNVALLAPKHWKENYRLYSLQPEQVLPYHLYTGRVIFPGYENRGLYYTGIRKAFKASRPDVVLLMEEPYSLFAWQILAVKRRLAPVAKVLIYTWDNLTYGFQHIYRPHWLYRYIDQSTLDQVDAVLCANSESMDVLRSKGFRKLIRLVWHGVELKQFQTQSVGDHAGFVIGYLGRILKAKGIDDLLSIIPDLPEYVTATIVGNGPDRDFFQSMVKNLHIEDRVRFLDGITPECVPGILSGFDCVVLPSRTTATWKEQFGRVIVEAMSAGVPVIGANSGAIPEVINHAGLIYEEGDRNELLKSCLQLIENPDLAARLSEEGRRRAEAFSTDIFINRIINCIHEVLVE